jgi:hypothetical protein
MNGVPAQCQLAYLPEPAQLTRRDTIRIKRLFVGQFLPLALRFRPHLLRSLRGPEAPTTLLIHFRPRGYTIDSHEKDLLRLDFCKEVVDIRKDR